MENSAADSSLPNPRTRKRWFRFSISTLLLVSVIVALSISHWTSARDRLALELKLDQIRQDHDLLEITDPTKIHVLPLPSPIHRMGQARVYLPEGSKYLLRFDWQDVPREEEPHTPYPGKELLPGTYLLEYAIQYVPMQGSGRWVVNILAQSQDHKENIYSPLPWDTPKWLEAEYVGNRDFRLLDIDPNAAGGGRISFWDTSGLKLHETTKFDEFDEATIVQTGVGSEAATLGALIHPDPISTDNVFRIWIEKAPKKP